MRLLLVLATASLIPAKALADWPAWRGPGNDGIVTEQGLLTKWPEGGPKELWRLEVGRGYSSPVAVNDRVYVFARVDDNREVLYCINAEDGKPVWTRHYDGGYKARGYQGTRASPLVDGDTIYTYGGAGDLVAWSAENGDIKWRKQVQKDHRAENLQWGLSSSPVIVGENIIVQVGKGGPVAVAVNRSTGDYAWASAAKALSGYATVLPIKVGEKTQAIVFGGDRVHALDPQTGKTLWSMQWKTSYDINATLPLYRDGHLFLSSGYKKGGIMLTVSEEGFKEQWKNAEYQARFNPPILDRDHVYINSETGLICFSWPDGKLKWKAGRNEVNLGVGGSLVRFGEHLLGMSERGRLHLIKATPAGFSVVSQVDLLEGNEIWATPLIYKGRLYAKGMTELVCLKISE